MSASMDSDTSGSDDEETIRRLQEAVVDSTSLIGNISTSKQAVGKELSGSPLKYNKKQSNRFFAEPEEANELKTTPEFRHFVSKKLSLLLDSKLEEVQRNEVSRKTENMSDDDNGIKLLYSSNCRLNGFKDETEQHNEVRKRKHVKKNSSSSEDSSEDERISEAAVSYDFVMEQSKQLHGSLTGTDVTEGDIYSSKGIVSEEQDSGKGNIKCDHKHLVQDKNTCKRKITADSCSGLKNNSTHASLSQPAGKGERKKIDHNASDVENSKSKQKKYKHKHQKTMFEQK
ncbi:hypothetical protein CHS0354_041455 [Potamilus streckersoni]|uniref:Protein CUSTOS n=1 Tax=Potamilus streckersoni TaxID=2493646 RepID=A0AAE0T9Z6_9BIVA|nr:hypothetical protein CHS0354_041455 [Potamilus streckersoni]